MLTLINDNFGFSQIVKEDYRKTNFNKPYFQREYDKNSFDREFQKILGEKNALCDLSLLDFAKTQMGIDFVNFQDVDIINDFEGFNVSVYQGFDAKCFFQFLSKTKAKLIDFELKNVENGYRFLELDKDMAYKKAVDIVLDAYDNGADFLVVGDDLSFKMFDTFSDELMRTSNRDFKDFYILHIAEFVLLANNKIPTSLKNHKLKVSLI